MKRLFIIVLCTSLMHGMLLQKDKKNYISEHCVYEISDNNGLVSATQYKILTDRDGRHLESILRAPCLYIASFHREEYIRLSVIYTIKEIVKKINQPNEALTILAKVSPKNGLELEHEVAFRLFENLGFKNITVNRTLLRFKAWGSEMERLEGIQKSIEHKLNLNQSVDSKS